ncbi:MAG: hypothetical protein WC296_00305 [Candidatus Izemoplasmatales bacterium]|jgi:[citrate (pro-3S)-lyase] ligase|nr:hypothetical protein [Candidatus Izemoplasmatales bacterium]MDD4595451.1 hypothetical protein [Candidatus Izemoplasmatales bacterium]
MIIKQALLDGEIAKVKAFLLTNDLRFDERVTETLYIEVGNQIIGTVSRTDYLIECLAVDKLYRGENIAGLLTDAILSSMRKERIYHYFVYTKTEYIPIFQAMNFRLLAKTDNVCIFEGGSESIDSEIAELRHRIENKWSISMLGNDFGAIVVNCNPITMGHYQLIEYAAKKHDHLIVLVVEEDFSMFTYRERFGLVWLALANLENVIVLPSTKYIVSNLTFPGYFLKSMDEREEEHAKLDAQIFKSFFLKGLCIAKRYVGTETDQFMIKYNNILKTTLDERLEIIPRFQVDGINISASVVRKLILENRIDDALRLVPRATWGMFRALAQEKYEQSRR